MRKTTYSPGLPWPIWIGIFIFLLQSRISLGLGETSPLLKQSPVSVENLDCGEYLISGKMEGAADGRDYLVLYPESERSFSIPVRGLKARDSMQYQEVMGVFKVRLPLIQGKKSGWFDFEKFQGLASLSQVYHHPVKKIGENCRSVH